MRSSFWKAFALLAAASLAVVPAAGWALARLGAAVGIDLLLIVLFAVALRLLARAATALQFDLMGIYFLALSTYASGAMAYGVEARQIDRWGWEWALALLDVTVILVSTSTGTRCFYEAVILRRKRLKQ
ncbi:MAG TPA: hypothetical protein VIM58_09540 [Candidatus Methylacidiphilales bacterium]